jgi:hypothetical protein
MSAPPLCVALLVPGHGEKHILQGIRDAGGSVDLYGTSVYLPRTATDAGTALALTPIPAVLSATCARPRWADRRSSPPQCQR